MAFAIAVFIFLLLIGTPIAIIMALSGAAGSYMIGGERLMSIIADRMFAGVASYMLIAIPYFIFTAELMNQGGLTQKLITFNNALFGRIRGALSHVNVTVSIFFAGLTGAAITDTVAIGKILIPSMKEQGYDAEYAAAVTACSSIIGPIIPPSIVMVIYASLLRDVSVMELFVGGIIPGLVMAAALLVISFIFPEARLSQAGCDTLKVAFTAFLAALPALLVPSSFWRHPVGTDHDYRSLRICGRLYPAHRFPDLPQSDVAQSLGCPDNDRPLLGDGILSSGSLCRTRMVRSRSGIAHDAAQMMSWSPITRSCSSCWWLRYCF